MTDEQIEKALFENYNKPICEWLDCYGVLTHIKRLKAKNEALMKEADENAALAMEQKLRADKLETKLQANLEKAYDHNTEECKRCMNKVEFKQQCAEEVLKEQIRKETAKQIIGELRGDMAIATFTFNPTLASELKTICLRLEKEYDVEANE